MIAGVIGGRVRASRAERGWTLEQLAERSRVSRRMLVNIEQGTTNPSIATLLRVSDALGLGLPALVDVGSRPPFTVTRAAEAPVLWHGAAGGQAVLVAGTEPPDVLELWDWKLGPGEVHHSAAHTAGTRELLLVQAGQVDLQVDQNRELLNSGDAASFRGDRAHGYQNPSLTEPARFVLSVLQPQVGRGPST